MKRKIVLKITLLVCVALSVFAAMSCGLLAYSENKLIGNNLISLANGYAGALIVSSDPQQVIEYDTNYEVRVTIIDADGNVLADSYATPDTFDNHASREEIINANNKDNTKIVRRYSQSNHVNMLYFAKKVAIGDSYQYVRVAMETADVGIYLTGSIIAVIVLTIAIALLATIPTSALIDRSLKPLAELSTSLEKLKSGDFRSIPNAGDGDRLDMLITKINDVGDILAQNIKENAVQKAKLDGLLANMTQGVIVSDMDGMVTLCNPSAEEIFQCENMLGQNEIAVLRDIDLVKSLKKLKVGENAQQYFDKNGRNYSARLNRLKSEDWGLDTIMIVSDVTELNMAERERREFFANASHELKTPLTAIKGYSELISEGIATGDKAKKYGANIGEESQILLETINDMLTLAKLDERVYTKTATEFNVVAGIEGVLSRYDSAIKNKNISTIIEGEGTIKVVKEDFDTIIANILSNAIKYNADNGTIDININTEGKSCVVSIKDSGIGIAKKDLPRITERFYKADSARVQVNSTGLGLAIVKHLCYHNNINLKIESQLGVGSEVILKFRNIVAKNAEK